MNLYNLPGLDGYKTLLGGWGTLLLGIAGTIATIGAAIAAVGGLLTGTVSLADFGEQIQPLMYSLGATFVGLTGLGIGHKIEKATK